MVNADNSTILFSSILSMDAYMRETCDSARVHDLIAVDTASESRRRSTKSSIGKTTLLDGGRVPRSGNIRS
jgi:hypothetical protein